MRLRRAQAMNVSSLTNSSSIFLQLFILAQEPTTIQHKQIDAMPNLQHIRLAEQLTTLQHNQTDSYPEWAANYTIVWICSGIIGFTIIVLIVVAVIKYRGGCNCKRDKNRRSTRTSKNDMRESIDYLLEYKARMDEQKEIRETAKKPRGLQKSDLGKSTNKGNKSNASSLNEDGSYQDDYDHLVDRRLSPDRADVHRERK